MWIQVADFTTDATFAAFSLALFILYFTLDLNYDRNIFISIFVILIN